MCVCTETANFYVISGSSTTLVEIEALVARAAPEGSDVTVTQSGSGYMVTISGDRDASDIDVDSHSKVCPLVVSVVRELIF